MPATLTAAIPLRHIPALLCFFFPTCIVSKTGQVLKLPVILSMKNVTREITLEATASKAQPAECQPGFSDAMQSHVVSTVIGAE